MLRLSRLPKCRSINVRHTAPGHASPHFLDRARLLDPSHPAAALAVRNLPSFVCPHFAVRAFPDAILQQPADFVPLNPLLATGDVRARTRTKSRHEWWSRLANDNTHPSAVPDPSKRRATKTNHDAVRHAKLVAARHIADARIAALAESGRRNVSLLFHTSKKATSKSCVIRRRLRTKMTAAISLVVGRSADAAQVSETDQQRHGSSPFPLKLVSRPLQDNERFTMQGWTYLVTPELAIYKTPLPNLVQVVRKALLSLSRQSQRLESSWSSLPKIKAPPPIAKRLSSTRSAPETVKIPRRLHPLSRTAKHDLTSTRMYANPPVLMRHVKANVKK